MLPYLFRETTQATCEHCGEQYEAQVEVCGGHAYIIGSDEDGCLDCRTPLYGRRRRAVDARRAEEAAA